MLQWSNYSDEGTMFLSVHIEMSEKYKPNLCVTYVL